MRIELGELDRAELSELWLKRYALIKDIAQSKRRFANGNWILPRAKRMMSNQKTYSQLLKIIA